MLATTWQQPRRETSFLDALHWMQSGFRVFAHFGF